MSRFLHALKKSRRQPSLTLSPPEFSQLPSIGQALIHLTFFKIATGSGLHGTIKPHSHPLQSNEPTGIAIQSIE